MNRFSILFKIIILFFLLQSSFAHAAPPENSAQAVSVIDVDSGRILYEKNGDKPMPIASLTKIMTAIVAIENGNLSDKVTAGPNAVKVEGSSIYLRQGESLTLEDMLYGLMLRSGNDAAVAIAEHIGGSIEGFAFLMNQKAEMLGLKSTHFVNPHGLDHPDHYMSANDLAVLTAYALKNPVFQEIVKTKVRKVPIEDEEWNRTWYNKNKMLSLYPGADGVKTGYTKQAKRTLVSSATRDGRQIAVVTLNDGNDWEDSAKLLDYGFEEFQVVKILQDDHLVEETDINRNKHWRFKTMREFQYPLKEGELEHISTEVTVLEENIRKGILPSGFIQIYLNGEKIGSIPLKYIDDQKASTTFAPKETHRKSFFEYWLMFWKTLI